MGFFSKKKEKKRREFQEEEFQDAQQAFPENDEAYGYLDEAMMTSTLVSDAEKKSGRVCIDNWYTTSPEETETMGKHLNDAKRALKNPADKFFNERYQELQEVHEYCAKKHWNFSWFILLAGSIASMFVTVFVIDAVFKTEITPEDELERAEKVEFVDCKKTLEDYKDMTQYTEEEKKGYAEQSFAITSLQNLDTAKYGPGKVLKAQDAERLQQLKNQAAPKCAPEATKSYEMKKAGYYYWTAVEKEKGSKESLETRKNAEMSNYAIKDAEESLAGAQKAVAAAKTRFEKAANKSVEEYKAEYLKPYQEANEEWQKVKPSILSVIGWKFVQFLVTILVIFLLAMPVLYVIETHQYGWMITRHRKEASRLATFQKIGAALGTFFFGAAASTFLDPSTEVVRDSWGSKQVVDTDSAGASTFKLTMRMALFLIGLAVFGLTAFLIMTYQTIMGMKRNHDWTSIAKDAVSLAKDATSMAMDAKDKIAAKIEEGKNKSEEKAGE